MSLFGNGKIRSRVMKRINDFVTTLEQEHEQKCIEIDAEADQKKMDHADEMVTRITSKIL